MRKKVGLFVIIVVMLVCTFSFMACDNNNTNQLPNDTLKIEQVYTLAQEAGYTGTLEELIAAFKGDSAYKIAVSKGYKGTESEWLATLVGASGTNGANGTNGKDGANGTNGKDGITPHIGANGNWFVGTTDTGVKAKGENGSNGNDGTNGTNGKSAYQIWLANGHTGTEADFLIWLKGQDGTNGSDGTDGTNGKSAYQIWLANGHTGTEADFLIWLKGQDGTNGSDGTDGTNGLSTYEIFKKYNPDYLGSEEEWINDYINGRLVRFTITFKAAGSDDIVKSLFYGYSLTEIPAVPEKIGNTGEWNRTIFNNVTENIIVTAIYKTKGLVFELINDDTEYKLVSANLESNVKIIEIPSEYV